MLRDYRREDLEPITAAIQAGIDMSAKRIASYIDANNVLVYDDRGIRGVAVWSHSGDGDEGGTVDLWIYTHPDVRRRGLGRRLCKAALHRMHPAPAQIVTFYRADDGDGRRFFRRRGFKNWFTLVDSIYDGPGFPESDQLQVHEYEDGFFRDYAAIINECFHDLRRQHDIRPYTIFPESSMNCPDTQRRVGENSSNIFMFTADGAVVGVGVLEDPVQGDGNGVDVVAVRPGYRRRGYGRLIAQFCINRIRERGFSRVYIAVMASNIPARKLYEGMGCRPVAVYDEARLFLKD